MSDIKPRYLVMVTASSNNNKYYKQIPNGDNTWTSEYGRVGSNPQKRTYSMSQWDSKYKEKVKKGYIDQSNLIEDLIEVHKKEESQYKEIDNKVISDIVEHLQSMAKKSINDNYSVSSDKVTQAMIDEAQNELTKLISIIDLKEFNNTLLHYFTVIPRKMGNVKEHLAVSKEDFGKIIDKEQSLLDVMKGQVVQKQIIEEDNKIEKKDITILEQLGIVFEECDSDDIARIKAELCTCVDKFDMAWKVTNLKRKKCFNDFVKENNIDDIRLLFHGSRNENWWSIINTGLVLKPTNAVITGKMFGYGIYYAPKAEKSLGYTSFGYWTRGNSSEGYMALMEVAYGKPYDVYSFDSKFHNFNYDSLQNASPGANCLHAHAGTMLRNDEIIIYKEEQCNIKYLIRLKNK